MTSSIASALLVDLLGASLLAPLKEIIQSLFKNAVL
jgi:hypothetical protein